jgi:hypothetical protein
LLLKLPQEAPYIVWQLLLRDLARCLAQRFTHLVVEGNVDQLRMALGCMLSKRLGLSCSVGLPDTLRRFHHLGCFGRNSPRSKRQWFSTDCRLLWIALSIHCGGMRGVDPCTRAYSVPTRYR